MNIGEAVRATVIRTEVYGVYCQCETQDLLILIPELSWIPCFNNCRQFAEAGDELTCKIIREDRANNVLIGSIRALHPENDPWKPNWRLQEGELVNATVVRWVEHADRCNDSGAYLLELRPAAYVMLCGQGPEDFEPGNRCKVQIVEMNQLHGRVQVKLAPQP